MMQETVVREWNLPNGSIPISGISTNTENHLINVTEDKLRLIFRDDRKSVESSKAWIPSASVALSLVVSMVTTDFKSIYGLSADQWKTAFVIVVAIAIYKAIWQLWRIFRNPPMNESQFVAAVAGAAGQLHSSKSPTDTPTSSTANQKE
ncbi:MULTISPECIES: hypothetical protein [Achromobacter]|uniref:Holin n=1 Tax=Achromobacter spanius TaxID=217203 RepID=A0ABY8GSP1_9BURK|nr:MULTISPECIES: hypothetical protein [Achromobacter]WAI83179.1 hypothetical protein N8Z00_27415 [Achromobacter spanius]WEX93264.1 hypothetical protein N3Z32_22010 [Achromobacter sp. SS2-2022]WFP07578.1 hypothetical protein P8T11_25240 [Achromobacter spanius]